MNKKLKQWLYDLDCEGWWWEGDPAYYYDEMSILDIHFYKNYETEVPQLKGRAMTIKTCFYGEGFQSDDYVCKFQYTEGRGYWPILSFPVDYDKE